MSLVCSLSNETPETPVISPVSGHVFEKRLILKYIDENGCDPVNGEPLTAENLIAIKASPFVLPKPPSATSIPAILKALQDEWDAVMLQSFTLRQHLQTARQELSHALYQHDAACRVIARLTKEVSAAREALATLKPQAGAPITAQGEIQAPKATQEGSSDLQQEVGMSDELKAQLQEASVRLTAERKKRGKNLPEGLTTPEDISAYSQIASQTGLHSSSVPGVLCLDICKNWPERIITGGNDKNATIFNISSSQVISMLTGHSKKVTHVAYHPNEQVVFTGSADNTVRVWGAEQGQCASMLRAHSSAISGLSVHTSGDFVLSSSYDGTWAFNDIRRGQVLVRVNGTDTSGAVQNLTCAQCHPDGIILGTGTTDGEIKIWDLKQKKNVANFSHGSKQDIKCISFSENGYFLASCGSDGQIKLWDLRRLKNFKTIIPDEDASEPYDIRSIDFDQSGTYLGVSGSDARVYVVKTWDHIKSFNEHTATVTSLKFGKLARSILTSSLDRSVKIYSSQPME